MGRAASVTILILLLCAVTAQGIPILVAHGRCHCTGTSAKVIPPKSIRSLKFIPSGSHCENAEIIVTLKNEKKVCVDLEAKWLEILIKKGNKHHKGTK
ncbi:interleukin-8-like [Leucoraja erinacea]|uniref:interleukin-8-like n=1 Tax=Leucoraja erinaceus TaxID=7782 RepID=UPI002458F43C|nr:interleukin-8-like [Leucoraja erinacea]